jgi:ADP-ribose pyrophosphatase YjhB (NUDIX family)
LPGGKREAGESDWQALSREIREELGVELIEQTSRLAGVFEAQAHGKPPGTVVRMTCYWADFSGSLEAKAEIQEFSWLSYSDKSRSSPVDQKIFDWLQEAKLLD